MQVLTAPKAPLALPSEDIGAALGALGSIRSAGASVATAIYVSAPRREAAEFNVQTLMPGSQTTILNNKLADYLPKYVTPAATNAGLPQSSLPALFAAITAGDLTTVPGITPRITAAVGVASAQAAAISFRYVWYAVCAFAACAVIASCLTINYGEYLNDTVERKLHGKTVDVVADERDQPNEKT